MTQWSTVRVASIGDTGISLADFLATMKAADALSDVVNSVAIRHAAKGWGIAVDDMELQAEADSVRRRMGLTQAESTRRWLTDRRLSVDEWEGTLEANVLRRKVRDKVVRERGRSYFGAHQPDFDTALLHRIVVVEQALADDLKTRLADGRLEFAKAARQYSADGETRRGGGFLGYVQRADLAAETARAVFAAHKGDIVGPLQLPGGGFELLWIEDLVPAAYTNDACRGQSDERCFREWLAGEAAKARVDL